MIEIKDFGKTLDKKSVKLFSLKNKNGMQADVINYGAILVNLFVPNNKGEIADVVLGYDRLKDYFVNGSCFGATIGPVANRTAGGRFEIDGTEYNLTINDNQNNLHSDGKKGFHKSLWTASTDEKENSVSFLLKCKDGELGFPGNREITVTYRLTEDNALEIHYHAVTDKKTLMNPTNHSYFNLKGQECDSDIENESIMIKASHYTKVVMGAIPTGELAPVADTVFDFTTSKRIGERISEENVQLSLVGGYDHNYVIDDYEQGRLQKVAELSDNEAGRIMEVYTDLPGIQLYTGNSMEPEYGKNEAYYGRRYGVALETQFFPNSANQEGFQKPVITPDEPFSSTTVYKFR